MPARPTRHFALYLPPGAAYTRTITDNVGITDAVSTVGTFVRTITDNVGITDALSRVKAVAAKAIGRIH